MISDFTMPSHVIYFHHYLRWKKRNEEGNKNLLWKITYIRRDPYLSPIASNFWTGSNAIAVGLCGKPWRNVCKIKRIRVKITKFNLWNKNYYLGTNFFFFSSFCSPLIFSLFLLWDTRKKLSSIKSEW